MIKTDIFSGFLGAGKTTLIKKLIKEAYKSEKLVLIENEFGQIGIDSEFMKESGVEISEMNQGCICCSLVGDFEKSLKEVVDRFNPTRILIEPSGVGKLSDVQNAIGKINEVKNNSSICVVDVNKCKMYIKNFGEFFVNQIENASCIYLSHTDSATIDKINTAISLIREHNKDALIITTPHDKLNGEEILKAIDNNVTLDEELEKLKEDVKCHHHHHHDHDEECECHHHHHDHDEECECHHHHHDHDEECECHHHHHDHDEECDCHHHHDHDEECECHHHHHDHDEECECHHHHHDHDEECECHHHHHDHDHSAHDVFTSWGVETENEYSKEEVQNILSSLADEEKYGIVLRAKGILKSKEDYIHFDYVPDFIDVRTGTSIQVGRICVIGSKLNEENLAKLFNL